MNKPITKIIFLSFSILYGAVITTAYAKQKKNSKDSLELLDVYQFTASNETISNKYGFNHFISRVDNNYQFSIGLRNLPAGNNFSFFIRDIDGKEVAFLENISVKKVVVTIPDLPKGKYRCFIKLNDEYLLAQDLILE